MKKIIHSLLLIICSLGIWIFAAVPVHATTIANPDSDPTVDRIRVYRNLLETGDCFYIFLANIPYATPPAYRVDETYLWMLMNGSTSLGYITGYAYNDDGYNYNVYGMYFSAADSLTWGSAYTLRLSGNPSYFTTVPHWDFSISVDDYYADSTASSANQEALADEILYLADVLSTEWGLTGDNILTLESETGTVLSMPGEEVFRGAIYGVQGLAPSAFRYVVQNVDIDARSWNSTYVDSLDDQWAGSWVDTARNASIALLGTSYDLTSLIILLVLLVALVVSNIMLTGDHWNGIIDALFILIIAARLGIFGLLFLGLLTAIAIIYIGAKLWRMIPTN